MGALTEQLKSYQADDTAMRPPTEAELRRTVVAPGSPALLPAGILYAANWQNLADGIARHARAQVRALAAVGMPVALRTITSRRMLADNELDPQVLAEVGYLRNVSISQTLLGIKHTIVHSHSQLHNLICPPGARLAGFAAERAVYGATILYTSWERSTVDKRIVEILERCGQVWVPCNTNADVFVSAGVPEEKVRVVPQPYEPRLHPPSQIPAPRGKEDVPDGKRFYAIGKWEPRKNYHALIGAFLKEFKPSERASLCIKTHSWGGWKDYPSPKDSLVHWLDDSDVREMGWNADNLPRRVRIITAMLTEEELCRLHQRNNIYVSPSHGEAWELGAFDALCAGNALVHVGWGGSEDYAGTRGLRVPHVLGPVAPDYGWEPDAQWAVCSEGDLRKAMRQEPPPTARIHPPDFYGRYGPLAVGEIMKRNILELLSQDGKRQLRAAGGFG